MQEPSGGVNPFMYRATVRHLRWVIFFYGFQRKGSKFNIKVIQEEVNMTSRQMSSLERS